MNVASIVTPEPGPGAATPQLIGNSRAFDDLKSRLPRVADAERTTLVVGQTGTGKDVVARSLHALSARRDRPFVPVHCAALPDTLIEAELFGHHRGAFTGAMETRDGIIRSAQGGTIFLDEIDTLPLASQAKLLRFLETGEYRAVGADRVERSDAWIIAATNQDLTRKVELGEFRVDLLYRLAIVQLGIPRLADRSEDVLELADHFLRQATDGAMTLGREARLALRAHDWPGNVRELRHRIESAAIFSNHSVVTAADLGLEKSASVTPSSPGEPPVLEDALWSLIEQDGLTLAQAMLRCEQMMVHAALRAEDDNRTRAASRLGIHVRTIFKKLA